MNTNIKEVSGVFSCRPELRCPPSTALQNSEDREWKINLGKQLKMSSSAIHLEGKCAEALLDAGYSSTETPFLFQLEKSLLDVSSTSLSDGAFYCTLFRIEDDYYCRFFESGVLRGYFLSEGIKQVKSYIEDQDDDFTSKKLFWCQVFTQDDINQYHHRYTVRLERKRSHQLTANNPASDIGKRFNTLMVKNKSSVANSLRNLMAKAQEDEQQDRICRLLGTVVNVIKRNSHKEKNPLRARFMECSGVFHLTLNHWEASIQTFRRDGVAVELPEFKFVFDAPSSSKYTFDEQCKIISCIPNNHYWNESSHAHVGYSRMLSLRDSTGKYKPASLRNSILMYHRENNYHPIFQVINKFRNPESCSSGTADVLIHSSDHNETDVVTNPSHREVRPRRKALTEDDILRNLRVVNPHFSSENRASQDSLYDQYKTAQIETGKLFWRVHQPDLDIICMNDVSMGSGCFLDSTFVHMSRNVIGDQKQYQCTCSLYATLIQLATLNEEDIEVDDVNIQCCHIRFFKEVFEPNYVSYFNSEIINHPTKSQRAVINSLPFIGNPVCELQSTQRTRKFSVLPKDSINCKFVHFSKNRLACQSGECSSTFSFSTRKVLYLENTTNLCPHLNAMKIDKDIWLVEHPVTNLEDDEEEDEIGLQLIDDDEDDIETVPQESDTQKQQTNNFNAATGLWDFPSLSEHCPKFEDNPLLKMSINKRLTIFDGADRVGRDSKGYLCGSDSPFILCPPLLEDGCLCGGGYFSDDNPDGVLTEVKYRPVIYLSNGPARFEVRDRECLARNPECVIHYNGSPDSLHFLSKETAAGDEMGWDYIDHALNTHITFTAYCKIMNKKYKRYNSFSASFMSPQTFISWWFSWSSKFKIDFRKPCSVCKFNPKFLACDGTKIGISFKNANINPIEKATDTALIDPCHRRNDRAFLQYDANNMEQNENMRQCRNHLAYMSKKHLKILDQKEILVFEEEVNRSTLLIESVPAQCTDVMRRFVCNEYPEDVQMKLAVIFKFLSSNHSLSCFIPFRYTDLFESILAETRTGQHDRIKLIAEFSPEICSALYAALPYEQTLFDILSLFQYLISRVKDIKERNKEPAPAVPQPGSYNPERSGVAYYFSQSGEKLRDIPVYTMNENAHSKNYDDLPSQADEQCNKIYPEVSRRGTTYLFLWFDPKHYGHCYGFHIITGSEGRKDPFSSAYSYLEEAPLELFYDFSCQLEEYCMNREPGFWEKTRFWHDLFHGYSHKCPFCYKSQRLCPLQGINTEICEQFNAFIQKIKYSARSMSLGKFCYYLQFMIYQWCEMKRLAFEKRCDIAAAYLI